MPYHQPHHARYSSVDSTTSPCSHQPTRPSSVDTIVAAPSPTRAAAAAAASPDDHWRFHYIDLDTMYPSISPKQMMMPDLRALGLQVPRRPSFESAASIPWETVKREHDVTGGGRSSPSSLRIVTTSVVSHLAAWRLEIAGLVLGLVAVACLGGVVARFDGEPLEVWPSRVITLNAVVAVLVTVGTAGMGVALASGMGQMKWVRFKQGRAPLSDLEYFDEASRGAWGGLGLLFRMRGGFVFPCLVGLWEAEGLTCLAG